MSIAMTLYEKHFYANLRDTRTEELKVIVLNRTDYKLKLLPTNEEEFTFGDNSKLIFTWDNVQVSLF